MNLSTVREIVEFLRERKKLWMLPVLLLLLVSGIVVVATTHQTVAPLIYTLF